MESHARQIPMNDLNVFRIFIAAAEAGNFAGAALTLGLTRSAVAKAIARLEEQTQTRLFQRTTRVVKLTHEGEALLSRATEAIRELDSALDDMTGRGGQPRGLLRMTAPDAYGRMKVLPALTKFLLEWPELEAEVTFNDRTVDVVGEGFDLALRVGAGDVNQEIISRVIARHRVSFCAAPAYLAQFGQPDTLEQLHRHSCLQFMQRGQRQPWKARREDGELIALDIKGRVRFDNGQALLDAAINGLGIVQMADFLVDAAIASGTLIRVLEANEPEPLAVFALYPTRRYLSPKVRLFIDSLIDK